MGLGKPKVYKNGARKKVEIQASGFAPWFGPLAQHIRVKCIRIADLICTFLLLVALQDISRELVTSSVQTNKEQMKFTHTLAHNGDLSTRSNQSVLGSRIVQTPEVRVRDLS